MAVVHHHLFDADALRANCAAATLGVQRVLEVLLRHAVLTVQVKLSLVLPHPLAMFRCVSFRPADVQTWVRVILDLPTSKYLWPILPVIAPVVLPLLFGTHRSAPLTYPTS